MTDSSQHQKHQATISTTDSLADAPVGTTIAVSFHDVDRVQAQAAPSSVNNWEYFNGALLAVCFQYGNHHTVEGTAVMIGVGLALSAKHVFDEHCDALAAGEAVMFCFGLRPNGVLDIWHCYRMMTHNSGEFGDLELLSLTLVSDMPADHHFSLLSLTTRKPQPGEPVTVVGFRFEDSASRDSVHDPVALAGQMYLSQGAAGAFSYPIHDSVLAPYPTIEIFSGSLGGMSGGAVFDVNGHVVGITSLGLQGDDQQGPTLAAWWMSAYFWRPEPTWPAGLYQAGAAISEMPELVRIVGREHVQVLNEPQFALADWK